MTYYLPDTGMPWSRMFGIMEFAKREMHVEDYSISQTTLEQIFLQFTKYQKAEGGDADQDAKDDSAADNEIIWKKMFRKKYLKKKISKIFGIKKRKWRRRRKMIKKGLRHLKFWTRDSTYSITTKLENWDALFV